MEDRPVIFERINNVGVITLNRPKKLNALNHQMIEEILRVLEEWRNDENIKLLILEGAGDRAFCAGGDVRSVCDMALEGKSEEALDMFKTEFDMDYRFAEYPKPILACLNGITMGGGIGMSASADFRLVTERTVWAMPEMKIGFFPDVGVSYYLARLERGVGKYLAMTAASIKGDDCVALGLADYKLSEDAYEGVRNEILNMHLEGISREEIRATMNRLLSEKGETLEKAREKSHLWQNMSYIEKYFDKEEAEEILEGLLEGAQIQGDEGAFAGAALAEMEGNSPLSMYIASEQQNRAGKLSLKKTFEQDYTLVKNFLKGHDFYEGVKAVLVEKSGKPLWEPALAAQIRKEDVEEYFR